MALSEEESEEIKKHLLKQLTNFPEDRRTEIENQINSMSPEDLEEFIKKNQLTHLGSQCIFCSIVAGRTPSVRIDEDSDNIAILEINPLSRGHTLIVPKDHSKEIPSSSKVLSKRVEKRLKEKLKPIEIKINEIEIMNHPLIEIIPLYGDETERKKVEIEELDRIKEEILKEEQKKEEIIPSLPPKIEPLFKIKARIP